jgi:hypothetical protein
MIWLDALDLLGGFAAGVWVTRNYFMPVVTIKVTKQKPETIYQSVAWNEVVEPIISQLNVASKLADRIVYNRQGAAAMAEILKTMGKNLDDAIERSWADYPERLEVELAKEVRGKVRVINAEHT